ncbi:MAG: DUF4157 domain-containing protein, partial [Thiohalophilus sp.]
MRKADQPATDRSHRYPMLNTGSQNLVSTAGEPLPLATRQFFEARLGRDFSLVRIHHDPQAA